MKYSSFIVSLTTINQENTSGDNNMLINNNTTNIDSVTVFVDKQSSRLNQKYLFFTMKFLFSCTLLLIIGLAVTMSIYVIKMNESKEKLEMKDKTIAEKNLKNENCNKEYQRMINRLKNLKQIQSKLNKMMLQLKIYCFRILI